MIVNLSLITLASGARQFVVHDALLQCHARFNYDHYVHKNDPKSKSIPNCNVLFANGELHQACGHVTLLMNM